MCRSGAVAPAQSLGERRRLQCCPGVGLTSRVHVQVQTEVLQKRQREKAHMMSAIKKYQKGEHMLS